MKNKRKTQELLNLIISRDILCCDTMLIEDLMKQEINGFQIDDITNFFDTSRKTLVDFIRSRKDVNPSELADTIQDKYGLSALADLEDNDLRELADSLDFNPDPHEIYEWWRVTDWLAEAFEPIGEPILTNSYGNWWGRCATGQHILMDGTIQLAALKYI